MKTLRSLLAVVAVLAVALSVWAGANSVTVFNQTAWVLTHFYLSPVDEADWGPDQLGDQVIGEGDSFEIRNIPCDSYDVRLIDEDGDECIVAEVDICSGDEGWVIDSEALLECEGN
jgi:hypothetical protein